MREQCTTAKANGKIVQSGGIFFFKQQALVEHSFGTIKLKWSFDHIITKKGIKKTSADFGLIDIAYNLRRMFSLGINSFQNPYSTLIISFITIEKCLKQSLRDLKLNLHPKLNFEYDCMQSVT